MYFLSMTLCGHSVECASLKDITPTIEVIVGVQWCSSSDGTW